jgi:hypothetical protein
MRDRIAKVFEDLNKAYPGSFQRIGVNPSNPSGLIPRCPSIPLQGTNAIHEEESQNEIAPLQLNDATIEGFIATEQGKPSVMRYKLIKDGKPMPVDPKKENSEDVGHTKEQILKKLSLSSNKIKNIKQFITYSKNNEKLLKDKQQKIG